MKLVRIDTNETKSLAKSLEISASNFGMLAKNLKKEFDELKEFWQGSDASLFQEKADSLTLDLQRMEEKLVNFSRLIHSSAVSYENRMEENIAYMRSKLI